MTTPPWQVTVFTLFPEIFPGPLACSILGNALDKGLWALKTVNIRDYADNKHNTVDEPGFGGGPGMVMMPDVVDRALMSNCSGEEKPDELIYLSPRGKPFTQNDAKRLANAKKVAMLCGRFEGIDQRVLDHWQVKEVSLGDFILAGGEIAAMAVIEASLRFVPGVVGTPESVEEESFSYGLLEAPHYTKPRVWKDMAVPDVLLSGHHENIRKWRLAEAEKVTQARRTDLWEKYLQKEVDQ
jgi:tRNA (guanine37-N1)-methyltransferase